MRVVVHNYLTRDANINKRNEFGVKYSDTQYRKGNSPDERRVLWVDGLYDHITQAIVADIRAKGFKCWRNKAQVWVREVDLPKISAAGVRTG